MRKPEKCIKPDCRKAMSLLVELLKSKGYRVSCEGKHLRVNGAELSVDCIARQEIGPVRVSIGIITIDSPTADTIEQALVAKNMIPLDKVIIVSDTVQRDLAEIAERLGIVLVTPSLLNLAMADKLRQVVEAYIEPGIGVEEMKLMMREAKIPGIKPIPLLGRRKRPLGLRLLYYPILCYHVTVHALNGGEAIATRDTILCLEAGSGSLVEWDDGLSIVWEWGQLGELDDDAVEVLLAISRIGTVSLTQLREQFRDLDAELAVSVLEEYGLIERVGGDMYSIAPPPLEGYKPIIDAVKDRIREKPLDGPCTRVLKPVVDPLKIRKIVEAIGRIEDEKILYYPVYMIVLSEEKSYTYLTLLVDGVTGSRLEDLEEVVRDSIMMKEIDAIIEEVERKPECLSEPAQPPHSTARPG